MLAFVFVLSFHTSHDRLHDLSANKGDGYGLGTQRAGAKLGPNASPKHPCSSLSVGGIDLRS